MAEPGFFGRHRRVLLYVPNLIGYARILCALYSFAVAFTSPILCLSLYFMSFVCDELDGRFARALSQTSTLGAVLDMVTDRLATTGLLMILAIQYPLLHVACISLVFLDIFSHWFQMYSTLLLGASTHKDTGSRSWLVAFYYSNRIFMGFCCVCCEVLYLCIYALYFPQMRAYRLPGVVLTLPAAAEQWLPGIGQTFSPEGLPYLALLAMIAVPGVAVKQVCNWVQLRNAVESLVDYEVNKRTQ